MRSGYRAIAKVTSNRDDEADIHKDNSSGCPITTAPPRDDAEGATTFPKYTLLNCFVSRNSAWSLRSLGPLLFYMFDTFWSPNNRLCCHIEKQACFNHPN